ELWKERFVIGASMSKQAVTDTYGVTLDLQGEGKGGERLLNTNIFRTRFDNITLRYGQRDFILIQITVCQPDVFMTFC
ncbi:MAG: hypothetical protein II640_06565, partial [Lachnospiraceae bacterium]|nr:hypothetical protein [Lachnospiraceae bacterium]